MPTALDNGSHRLRIGLGDFIRRLRRRNREPGSDETERELQDDAERRSTDRAASDEMLERFNVHDEE